ncbi:glucosidase [Rhodococcus sp. NPDC003318]|uniref:MGH1-like glycoside hydrolase domain-containing protein n=1 Tax=Rhodococcus sp. NPDC003318 TaxID=3364503 RepID=UPI0036B83D62
MTPAPDQSAGSARTAEHARLAEATGRAEDALFEANPWYEWGPYLAERAWGTVREDYSGSGDAWDFFPHDHARSRAYRWNEDGMAGLSDVRHELCLALALWNGNDPILKERMFGLTGPQGNHGEDVKEYWWYREALPSHALLQWRYHYPQGAYPYQWLIDENARRGRDDAEFELLDTGVFDEDRYWVVDVTYAKATPTDIRALITVTNRGPEDAEIDVLPTMWFRNTWRWSEGVDIPVLRLDGDAITVADHRLAGYRLQAAAAGDASVPRAVFCDNDTNTARLFGAEPVTAYPKDGIGDHVVHGAATVNPAQRGTKAAWWYHLRVPAGGTATVRLRLSGPDTGAGPGWAEESDAVLAQRRRDVDEFYRALAPADLDTDRMQVLRQSCAGLIWSKQIYPYDVTRWLDGDPRQPAPPDGRRRGRNTDWRHLESYDVLAMPDVWEYPWFAAWDLAFHTIPWAHLDPAFAKYQLLVLLRERFLHPNGALPAYEWSFDDVNPPVHALAALRVFAIDGSRDVEFLERVFQKLLMNFTWWLNRQDPDGNNIFAGGFLGLDNISPIDRSHLPEGVRLEQADATGWMAFYAAAMLEMALVLADRNPVYEDMVITFLEHFVRITTALDTSGLYDADDGFFYDRLTDASGRSATIRVQTLVGVIPALVAVTLPERDPQRVSRLQQRLAHRLRDITGGTDQSWRVRADPRTGQRRALLSVLGEDQLRNVLTTLLDGDAMLSPHGLRSLSRRFTDPYSVASVPGATIEYSPAESRTAMYGGNSNWRGPVWLPINYLAIRALLQYATFYGDDFTIEYPTGSGVRHTLRAIADDLADRLVGIWTPGPDGRRPVDGGTDRFHRDPVWHENLTFHEYFHGDNGAGLGAAHQTGWTAVVADLILDPPGGTGPGSVTS